MGCFDGAEVCELVGSYILSKLNSIFDKKNVGLEMWVFWNLLGTEIERKRKEIITVF